MSRVPVGGTRIPAVVVGGAGACGLGLVRSLSRADIPVILVDEDRYAPAMHTRFARKVVISRLSGPSLVRDLLALGTRIGGPAVLFLTSDEAALTVSEYRAELATNYRFRLPSHDCLSTLMHKTTFQQLAEVHGFPVPRAITIARVSDLAGLAELRFPVVVKPSIKTADYVKGRFARAYIVSSQKEAEAKCRLVLSAAPGVVVQEWIEGPDDALYFCLLYRAGEGTTVSCFTGRKLSIWPPDVGITASCTAAPETRAILQPLTEAFFERVSFIGMGGIEFKRDFRSGQFVMIEPTVGRIDLQEEVATINGVNIPLAAYYYEIGVEMPRVEPHAQPVVWRNYWADWRSARGDRASHAVTPGTKVCDAYWRLNDPMPGMVRFLDGCTRPLRHALRLGNRAQCTGVGARRTPSS
jgi:D-aspartate ligase